MTTTIPPGLSDALWVIDFRAGREVLLMCPRVIIQPGGPPHVVTDEEIIAAAEKKLKDRSRVFQIKDPVVRIKRPRLPDPSKAPAGRRIWAELGLISRRELPIYVRAFSANALSDTGFGHKAE